jgi:hypothetical protein
MPEHNLHGFHHGDRIDKGIMPVEHVHPAHNDIPAAGICGAPMRPDPHGRGPRDVVGVAPGRLAEHRPPGLLRDNGPLNPDPHPYNPASQVQQANTYAVPR